MAKYEPITPGTKFGRWTILESTEMRHYPSGAQQLFIECQCDCGTIQWVGSYKLRIGHSRSCGCLQAEVTAERSTKHGHAPRYNKTRIYKVWCSMLGRCTNPKNPAYEDYGARGITVCERWFEFENFLEDMGEPPSGLTIDRLDNDKGYFKENCAWKTRIDQARNRRSSVKITFDGLTLTIAEWSIRVAINRRTLEARFHAGWTPKKILTTPAGKSWRNA
jgi:hypothetical protein